MKLPWDIVDAKSSQSDNGVWTYPLKKALLVTLVYKNADIVGSWEGPELGRLLALARGEERINYEPRQDS